MYGQNFNPQPFNYNTPAMPYMPSFQNQQPTQQSPGTNISWVYVNGIDGAKSQIVQPGQTSWMMDNNEPVIYVKTVDSMGTANLKAFQLTEISAQPKPTEDKAEYVQKTDLDGLLSRIKALEDMIGGINS